MGGEHNGTLLLLLHLFLWYIHRLGVDHRQGPQKLLRDIYQQRTTQSRRTRERAVRTQVRQYRRMYSLTLT